MTLRPQRKGAETMNMTPFIFSAETPNAVTLAAMEQTDEMIRTGGGQHFQGTTEDFFAMLDTEE